MTVSVPPFVFQSAPVARAQRRWTRRLSVMASVCVVMYVGFWCAVLLDFSRPTGQGRQPALGILDGSAGLLMPVVFWIAAGAAPVALGLWLLARRAVTIAPERWSRPDTLRAAAITALQLPWALCAAWLLGRSALALLACLPLTAGAFWLLRRLSVFRRLPVYAGLGALLLGVIAFGYATAVTAGFQSWLIAVFQDRAAGDLASLTLAQRGPGLLALESAVVQESATLATVVLAVMLLRRFVDSVASAMVAGALVGLGFNLAQSASYAAAGGAYEFLVRQVLGVLGVHTAYGAIIGACIGLALPRRGAARARVAVVGLIAATGAHAFSSVLYLWYQQYLRVDWSIGPWLDVLVLTPLLILLTQGPVIAMYVLLARKAARVEAFGLAGALPMEVAHPRSAISPSEAVTLLDVRQRSAVRRRLRSASGRRAAALWDALIQAQYELAFTIYHHQIGTPNPDAPAADALRSTIWSERSALTAVTGTGAQRTAGDPAGSPGPRPSIPRGQS